MRYFVLVVSATSLLCACGAAESVKQTTDQVGDLAREGQEQEQIFANKLQNDAETAAEENQVDGVEQNPDGTLYYQPPNITVVVPTPTPRPTKQR